MKFSTKYGTEYISLGCRKPRDQMLVEFNQEGFHRRGGTRNGPKKGLPGFGYTERRLGRPCKQENTMRKGIRAWGWVGILRRLWGKKSPREEAKDRRGGARPGRMRR